MPDSQSDTGTLLIGIDDTDNLNSRGTGYRARCLGALLDEEGLGRIDGISRHQLLVSDEIPYTSHNSAACLRLVPNLSTRLEAVIDCCREFLRVESAPGSDAGLCVMPLARTGEAIRAFGQRAQREVLRRSEAESLAAREGAYLEGLTGDHGGMIGSLAAVGLRAEGADGRFVWVRGIRERTDQRCSIAELLTETGVDTVGTLDGREISDRTQRLNLGPWPRPIARGGRAVLLVEENHDDEDCQWRVIDRAVIKRF